MTRTIIGERAAGVRASQRIHARISTMDNDTLFWLQFSFNDQRAFDRILARKVGDAATFAVEIGWASHLDSPAREVTWSRPRQPYPPTDGNLNATMHVVDMDQALQDQLSMLIEHGAQDVVRRICRDAHDTALLCRAREQAGVYTGHG